MFNPIRPIKAFLVKAIHMIEVDISWALNPAHQQAVLATVHDVVRFEERAAPIVENIIEQLIPGSTPVVSTVATALNKLNVKMDSFIAAPSLQGLLQIGGEALRADIADYLPTAQHGIAIAGDVITSAEELAAIPAPVLQAVVAKAGASLSLAGKAEDKLKQILDSLALAITPAAPPMAAVIQPPPAPAAEASITGPAVAPADAAPAAQTGQ
jgi:hypothetical protein